MSASGGALAGAGTNRWYVKYVDELCVKDCDDSNDGECGGLAKPWDELFDDSSTCCSEKLHWVKHSDCTGP